MGRVKFGLSEISRRFGLGQVWLGLGQFLANQFLVKYARHAKISNFAENFESSMVRFVSIRVSNSLSSEHISSVRSDMDSDRLVQVSGKFFQVFVYAFSSPLSRCCGR